MVTFFHLHFLCYLSPPFLHLRFCRLGRKFWHCSVRSKQAQIPEKTRKPKSLHNMVRAVLRGVAISTNENEKQNQSRLVCVHLKAVNAI